METLFVNGLLWPLPEGGEAEWLLAREGRIAALGCGAAPRSRGVEVVDLNARTAIPGPVDSHCHLVSYGMTRLREADLRGVRSLPELEARLRAHSVRSALAPGDGRWLLGRGFDQDLLAEGRWPGRADLDRISPDRPLRVTRVCGHAVVANSPALRAAGLDPAACEERTPEGVLTEGRIAPLTAAIPAPSPEEWRRAALSAAREAAGAGFVGVHSLMAGIEEIRALVELNVAGELPVRVVMQPPYALLEALVSAGMRSGFGGAMLEFGAIKLFSDGSLGARTAALFEPYADAPSTSGELIYPPEELALRVGRVRDAGWQVCIHAIGDRALAVSLDAIEEAGAWALPPRIEHASLVTPALAGRMRRLGVVAAVQPQFARSDWWASQRLGAARARGCYAFRTLWEAGVPLAGSTDCPVEPLDALAA